MTAPWKALYCLREDQILYAGWINFRTDPEVIADLAKEGFRRSRKGIQCRRRALGISNMLLKRNLRFDELDREYGHPGPQQSRDGNVTDPASLVRSDHAFKNAMFRALRNGEEFAVLGVVKDRRPFALTTIHAEPVSSGYGSPALACADG
jgi:hypothetical protein